MDIRSVRQQFPILAQKTYFNSCSYGALAKSVRKAMENYLDDRDRYGAHWEYWVMRLEQLRQKTADLLSAEATEIALVSSLSAGLNALTSCLDFSGPRNRVVVTSYDFPTTAHIWHAQKRAGAQLVNVELDDYPSDDAVLDAFDAAIDERTLIVSVPYVCYRNGRRLDIKAITKLAHQRGAMVVVDAYQAVGTLPVDVRDLNADIVLGGYLKYLLGTGGLAYMYVKGSLVEQLHPMATGWFAQEDTAAMTIADNFPASSARRFESGTPNVSGIDACLAGLEIIDSVGLPDIAEQLTAVTDAIKQEVQQRDWRLATGNWDHGAMLAIASKDMARLVELLGQENVIVSCRDNNIRVSAHFYNDHNDVKRLFAALDKHRDLVKPATV